MIPRYFALRLVKRSWGAYCMRGWALGAVVSASRLHRVGRGFESLSAHHPFYEKCGFHCLEPVDVADEHQLEFEER